MDIKLIVNQKWVVPAVVGALSFTAGFGAGIIVSKRKESENELVEEDPQMTIFDFFDQENSFDESKKAHPSNYVEEVFTEEPVIDDEEIPEITVNKNVFSGDLSFWDYDVELQYRNDGQPYVIHYDEFMNNETNYPQETLTYYRGDDIVADQQDSPIYNYASLMGELRFGHGSNDPNVVYIRNDQIHMEWEILLHEGSYSYEVAGIDKLEEYEADDIRHANDRKFRMD
jgi:hypothetical protein